MIQRVVLDTNILVSSLWSSSGTPAKIVDLMWARLIIPCYDVGIMDEYISVLRRPHFHFSDLEISKLLKFFRQVGFAVLAEPSKAPMPGESDRKFYDAAKACGAVLITGNTKHYPDEPFIVTAANFLEGFTF